MQQALLSVGLPPPGINPGHYSGRVKSYNPKQGYGFLECPEARAHYGRDVFIHKAQMGELLGRFVGPGTRLEPTALRMHVKFSVEVNKAGMPQARDVVRMDIGADEADEPSLADPDHGTFAPPESSVPASVTAPVALGPLGAPPTAVSVATLERGGEEAPVGGGSEAWASDETSSGKQVKGYKGRGGTIRLCSEGHGAGPVLYTEDAVVGPLQGGLAGMPTVQDLRGSMPGAMAQQPMRGIRNRGWRPKGQRPKGGDPFAAQQEAWERMEEHSYAMHKGGGGASQARPREGGTRRGKKADYLHQRGLHAQVAGYDEAAMHHMFAPQGGHSYMHPQGAMPMMPDSPVHGGQCPPFAVQPFGPSAMQQRPPAADFAVAHPAAQMYGMQGHQPVPAQQAAPGPAGYAPPFPPQQGPPGPPPYAPPFAQQGPPTPQPPGSSPMQYPAPFLSHQFAPPPVQPPFQPDQSATYPQQFMPYQHQQQFQQPFPPSQLQMMQQAYGPPPPPKEGPAGCYGLDSDSDTLRKESGQPLTLDFLEELPDGRIGEPNGGDWASRMEQPGGPSGIPDAATPGSGSDGEDGLGYRVPASDVLRGLQDFVPEISLMHGGHNPRGSQLPLLPGGVAPCTGVAGPGLVAGGSPVAAAVPNCGGWPQAGVPMHQVEGLSPIGRSRDYLAL